MRDAYAMQLHSVPSRLSKKVIPDTSLQARWCAIFILDFYRFDLTD